VYCTAEGAGLPDTAEAAKRFNQALRRAAEALGARGTKDHHYAFLCECGCDEVVKLTLAEYDERDGAWLDGHRAAEK
jgi:hypothetical protein